MEKPIIFTGHMVNRVLAKEKTHTRRLQGLEKINIRPDEWRFIEVTKGGGYSFFRDKWTEWYYCKPRYKPGDILWIKESIRNNRDGNMISYVSDGKPVKKNGVSACKKDWKWKRDILTGMFLPKWASRPDRILVENCTPRRLNDMSEADAVAEGIYAVNLPLAGPDGLTVWTWEPYPTPNIFDDPLSAFMNLWDRINGKKYLWKGNPWVFDYQIKLI